MERRRKDKETSGKGEKEVNWFVTASAFCWLFGAVHYSLQYNWRMVIVSVCYALATFALMGAE